MSPESPRRPAEMVAASDQPVWLLGDMVWVSAPLPEMTNQLLRAAMESPEGRRIYVNVEDIQGDANPGVVYGVYLNRPATAVGGASDNYYIGNLALFGIEKMSDPDVLHEGVPGLRHTFDVTDVATALRDRGEWNPKEVTVTFEPLVPLLPPDLVEPPFDIAAEQKRWSMAAPIMVGRVSVFVEVA